ncbi:MAG: hypothetical protein VKK98_05135 [Cyanobacteriota bacterium]|nr:hypothetical protein [Cyanobacteriota bacterium]
MTSSRDPMLAAGLIASLRFAKSGIRTAVSVVGVLQRPKAEMQSID